MQELGYVHSEAVILLATKGDIPSLDTVFLAFLCKLITFLYIRMYFLIGCLGGDMHLLVWAWYKFFCFQLWINAPDSVGHILILKDHAFDWRYGRVQIKLRIIRYTCVILKSCFVKRNFGIEHKMYVLCSVFLLFFFSEYFVSYIKPSMRPRWEQYYTMTELLISWTIFSLFCKY